MNCLSSSFHSSMSADLVEMNVANVEELFLFKFKTNLASKYIHNKIHKG